MNFHASHLQEDELIARVENAARKGAREGANGAGGLNTFPALIMVFFCALVTGALIFFCIFVNKKWDTFIQDTKEEFSFGENTEDHDLIVDEEKLIGFTAADFAEAILGDSNQLRKLEVFEQEIADVVTITETGLVNIKAFEKTQVITYHGTATYTVDLGLLSKTDIILDEDNKIITLYIPHSKRDTINIPENQMEFGDVSKGLLAFGDIKLTPEQNAKIQTAARIKMENKLEETKAAEQADRFAKMSVWEIYHPVVSGVSPEYTLEISFRE